MKTDTVYRTKEEIVARKIADETILVPIRGKLADMQRIFSLNSVAEFIWSHLEKEVPLQRILSDVMDEFDVERDRAEQDFFALIDALRNENLIEQVA